MGLIAPWHAESSFTRDQTRVWYDSRWILIHCTTREHYKLSNAHVPLIPPRSLSCVPVLLMQLHCRRGIPSRSHFSVNILQLSGMTCVLFSEYLSSSHTELWCQMKIKIGLHLNTLWARQPYEMILLSSLIYRRIKKMFKNLPNSMQLVRWQSIIADSADLVPNPTLILAPENSVSILVLTFPFILRQS